MGVRRATAVAAGLIALPVSAQQVPSVPAATAAPAPAASAPADGAGDEADIVVTAARQPGAVAGDIKAELQLSPADIRSYGVSSVADLLGELAPQTRSDRGGGSSLILLNGRRISGFNEIRDLPTEAILRVDVLPEEVALKYGAPADARVVNIVLRPRFRSTQLEAGGGAATGGGAARAAPEAGYLRIRKNGRINVDLKGSHVDALTEADRVIVAAVRPGLADPSGFVPDVTRFRTLTSDADSLSANAVYNHVLPGGLSATANLRAQYDVTRGDNGLARVDLPLPPGSPFAPQPVLSRYDTAADPLRARTTASQLHLGATLNGDGARWRWSVIANLDRTDTRTRTDTGVDATAFATQVLAGGNPLAPFGPLAPRAPDTSSALLQSAGIDGLVSGSPLTLPAGPANVAVKLQASTSGFDGASNRRSVAAATRFVRDIVSGQVNVDLPVTNRKEGFGAAIGDLTVNGNVAAQHTSDFGMLTTVGYGLNWLPRPAVTVIASHTTDNVAPTAQQLQGPVLTTLNVAVFDPVTGTTAFVTLVSGGSPALVASRRNVTKLEVNAHPLAKPDLTLTATFTRTRVDNAIAAFPATSLAVLNAFPSRFVRDAAGELIQVDARAVNFAREATDTLRTGINLSIPLKSTQASPFAGLRRPDGGGDVPPVRAASDAPAGRAGGDASGGRPGGGGSGGGFGGGRGGRLQFAAYYSVFFRDDVIIRPGVPVLDLLNGGALGTGGGQARHAVEIQSGYNRNGLGARLTANWRSGTRLDAAGPAGTLTFSPLATANVRLFANLGQMPHLVRDHPWLRGSRVTLGVTNITDQRVRVRDASGATPLAYQPGYLDPVGRAVTIGFRKLFFTPPVRRAP